MPFDSCARQDKMGMISKPGNIDSPSLTKVEKKVVTIYVRLREGKIRFLKWTSALNLRRVAYMQTRPEQSPESWTWEFSARRRVSGIILVWVTEKHYLLLSALFFIIIGNLFTRLHCCQPGDSHRRELVKFGWFIWHLRRKHAIKNPRHRANSLQDQT